MAFDDDHPLSTSASSLSDLEVLVADSTAQAETYAQVFRPWYRTVTVTTSQRSAVEYLRRENPSLVVAALTLDDGLGVDICKRAKAKPIPASVLVTAERPEDVPEALVAGCDAVLLKPFPASLLINRTSRMMQVRMEQLRIEVARKRAHLFERAEPLKLGINREWPDLSCPYCSHQGATSFDYTSLRRAWYACLQCKKAWIGKRLDS